jgi:hypothetical protein
MAQINEIYKRIDIDTEACIESKLKTIRFKPRSAFRADCYKEVYNKYLPELQAEQSQNATLEDLINEQTISAASQQARNNVVTIGALLVGIIIIYFLFFSK